MVDLLTQLYFGSLIYNGKLFYITDTQYIVKYKLNYDISI